MRGIKLACKIFLIIFSSLHSGITFSQGLNVQEVIPNSPNAAELGKYGSVPVGLFTGTVQQNIPLFEFKTRNLSVPISLNYSSNGLIVGKMASWVGLDWSLNAGGVIIRSIRGKPDTQQNRGHIPSDFNTGHDYLLDFVTTGIDADFQPDIYSYNFNGNSGKFFFKDDMQSVAFIPYQNLKMEVAVGGGGGGYMLTTTDGVKYRFSSLEYTSTSTQFYVSSWYLTSIIHPDGDSIHFYYSTTQYESYTSGATQQVVKNINSFQFGKNTCYGNFCPPNQSSPQSVDTEVGVIYLDSIYAPNYGTVIFQRSGNRPDYIRLGHKLDSIIVKDNKHQSIKIIDLKYHFPANWNQYGPLSQFSSIDNIKYRMFLDTLIIKSSQAVPIEKYTFGYWGLDSLPSRLSFAQDHWGYFNGVANNDLVQALNPQDYYASYFTGIGGNKAPNGIFSKVSLLKKITYPTGGYSLMEYEPHISNNGEIGGCRIKKVSTYAIQGAIPQVTKYIYNPGQSFGLPTYFNVFQTSVQCDECTTFRCTTATLSSNSLTSLFNNDQYQISYPAVNIYYGENHENGAEEHQFQSVADAPGLPIWGGMILPVSYTNLGWCTGREILNTTYRDSSGSLLPTKSVQYNYSDIDSRNKFVQNCLKIYRHDNMDYCVVNYDYLPLYDVVQYTLYSIWSKLVSKTETEYYSSGNSTITTNYYYNNPTHALLDSEIFIDSRGDAINKKYYYPQDYNPSLFSSLISKFITGKPIDTRTYVNNKITSCLQNKYNSYGQITDLYKGEITNSTTDIPFNSSSAYTTTHRASYSYNSNKNLLSILPDSDAITSFIWGYSNTLPIAKVVNAKGSEIAYCGFEDRITTGNWNISSATYSYQSGSPARGKNYIFWNSGSITGPTLDSATKYRLRFYARSSNGTSVTLPTGIGPISISGDNQWHLYETSFQFHKSLTLTTSSAISLDEITLCPQNAMMNTFIYDPLVGIRSITDENEVTTYYEYDTSSRLIRIKDQNGNVLKEYKYNYAGY